MGIRIIISEMVAIVFKMGTNKRGTIKLWKEYLPMKDLDIRISLDPILMFHPPLIYRMLQLFPYLSKGHNLQFNSYSLFSQV